MATETFVPYVVKPFPTIKGGEAVYIVEELRRISRSFTHTKELLSQLEDTAYLEASTRTSSATMAASEFVNGVVTLGSVGSGVTLTTPTATQIIIQLGATQVGHAFEFIAVNGDNDQTLTISAGSGVSTVGTLTIAAGKTRMFKGYVTNIGTPAVRLIALAES